MGGRVLVLNATFEPINVCTVRRAVVLLLKEKAELLERGRWELHSESSTLARPVVIRLVSYVNVPRDAHRRKITRRAVFALDGDNVYVVKDGVVELRKVKKGYVWAKGIEILEGLKPGDQVITQGALGLDDKAKIEIKKPGTKDEDDK